MAAPMVAQVEDAVIARVTGAAGLGYSFGTVARSNGSVGRLISRRPER